MLTALNLVKFVFTSTLSHTESPEATAGLTTERFHCVVIYPSLFYFNNSHQVTGMSKATFFPQADELCGPALYEIKITTILIFNKIMESSNIETFRYFGTFTEEQSSKI